MPAAKSLAPAFPTERITLGNGLRVVLAPDRSAPAVGVAVYYDVGFRSEPEGRTGFAHLFEHLMFEGSVNLRKLQHAQLIQANGGVFNGSTTTDYTNYYEQLPSNALELGLFLEADRMRGVRLNEETLANQIAVVQEEIRTNILNRAYGGMGWIALPEVMFRTFNNAHDGYGSFTDLESATTDDAADFFDRYYAPGNAVLVVAGDLDVDDTAALVERHFGDIRRRKVPRRPDFGEPVPTEERRAERVDPHAPSPALVVGYRVPDPLGDVRAFLASVLLIEVLTDGESSRLFRRLVIDDKSASHVFGYVGPFGNPLEVRDPTIMQITAYHHRSDEVPAILRAVDDEVARLVDGLHEDELDRVRTAYVSAYLRRVDNLVPRLLTIAAFEQQRERPSLVNQLPALLGTVTAADVRQAAAEWMRPTSRAVLEWKSGATR